MADQWDRSSRLNIQLDDLWSGVFKKVGELIALRTCDDTAIAVLNQILVELGGTATGTPFYNSVQSIADGTVQDLIDLTVPAATTRTISSVVVSCRQPGKFTVLIDSTVVGTGRTGPGSPNASFVFVPGRAALTGEVIKVQFEKTYGPNSDVEAHLLATDT